MSSLIPDSHKSFQQRSSAGRSTTKLTKPRSTTRTPHATASASVGATKSSSAAKMATKSKFTENQPAMAPLRTRSHHQQATTIRSAPEKKSVALAAPTKSKAWNRNEVKPTKSTGKISDLESPRGQMDKSIQTNEPEILNRDLLIGDIKFLLPSKSLVNEIERARQENKKRALLKAQRKFEEHAEKQEEHLTDLKEFLEKAVVTKRSRKPKETLEADRKLMCSMDDILNREVRRTESITDIKSRIKKKEKELMTLFETVENIDMIGIAN